MFVSEVYILCKVWTLRGITIIFPFINLPVSNPCNPVNDGVSLNMFIIFKLASDGFGGAGPPPVFFYSLLKELNSLFA